jgi:hypothetical protein
MGQQLGIIILVDIANALADKTIKGNAYLLDNMKFLGSEGEGGQDLVTAVPGTYWSDGSQGSEAVLNWIPLSLGSIPPTVPRNYRAIRTQESDRQALLDLESVAGNAQLSESELAGLQRNVGKRVKGAHSTHVFGHHKLIDVTGNIASADAVDAHAYPDPVITNISGTAVDEKIIYPAEYGSPDMVSDGWYWSATVDTSRPGTYGYTIHLQLHELAERNGEPVWEPVDFVIGSHLRISTEAKRNAFTQAGTGLLPIPAIPAAPAPAAPAATLA